LCPKSINYDQKTELGAGERIPIFFFKSPPLRAVIAPTQVKISSTSKTCDKSDVLRFINPLNIGLLFGLILVQIWSIQEDIPLNNRLFWETLNHQS
jgi:hypothetical protein